MEHPTGFEPALGIAAHFQLPFSWFVAKGDTDALLAALRGFEPQLPESEAGVLPLDERAMNWCRQQASNPRFQLERLASCPIRRWRHELVPG